MKKRKISALYTAKMTEFEKNKISALYTEEMTDFEKNEDLRALY